MNRILSCDEIGRVAVDEFKRTETHKDNNGKLRSNLSNRECVIWHRAFFIAYAMGQENVRNSENVLLTLMIDDLNEDDSKGEFSNN